MIDADGEQAIRMVVIHDERYYSQLQYHSRLSVVLFAPHPYPHQGRQGKEVAQRG